MGKSRARGSIRRRGKSLQVLVYAGVDPLTGQRMYLSESTTDEAEARRILDRLRSQVDEQRHAKTRATFRAAMEAWLRVHEIEDTTRESYESYARLYLYPAFGDEPVGRIGPRVLEELYAELRRCRTRCDGRPTIDHRTDQPHECRSVRHRRPRGRPCRWLSRTRLRGRRLHRDRVLATRLQATLRSHDSPDSLHHQCHSQCRRALGLDQEQPRRAC